MIGDFVKGNKKDTFPEKIKRGIELHRSIDCYTDSHPATSHAKSYLRAYYGLYSGIYIDIIFDHFLANDKDYFDHETLKDFSGYVYETIGNYREYWPVGFDTMFFHMKQHNWLANYVSFDHTTGALEGITRRRIMEKNTDKLIEIFKADYEGLKNDYKQVMTDLECFVKNLLFDPGGV
jgi:acyl carrier protein phosphodiesterase